MNQRDELKQLLEGVSDTYEDFVHGILVFLKTDEQVATMIKYIKKNPNADSSEISYFAADLRGIPKIK